MQELFQLDDEQLERLVKRLTLHAADQMRKLSWRGATVRQGGAVPEGYEPDDFVAQSVQKALNGRREWNREKYPSVEDFLRSIIDSDIYHLVHSLDNALGRRLSPPDSEGNSPEAVHVESQDGTPLEIIVDRNARQKTWEAAQTAIEGDPVLEGLLECFDQDITKPAEIAVLLEISVDDVTNAKKRLR